MQQATKNMSASIIRKHTNLNKLFTTSVTSLAEKSTSSHTVGTCGIPKWSQEKTMEKEKKVAVELPPHLIRPPCMPKGTRGGFQTCVAESTEGGLYCPHSRLKYKYASFADNIDFMLARDNSRCWWQIAAECTEEESEEAIAKITKQN